MRPCCPQANQLARGAFTTHDANVTTVDELSPDLVAMVAARIDAALVEAAGPYEVSACLKLSEAEKRGPMGAVAMAFAYMLGSHGDEFGPIFETSDGHRYPPDLKDIPPGTWSGGSLQPARYPRRWLVPASTICASPEAGGNRGQTAREAAESYLQAAAVPRATDRPLIPAANADRTDHLQRAVTLARKIRDKALADRVIADTVAAARESLNDGDARPGVVLGLLRILAEDRTPP